MNAPQIATAVPGTVKAWFNAPAHFEGHVFPPGPWSKEPNKMQWVDAATELPCLIVRGGSGALCGYVGVPATHPFHSREYNDAPVDVHGDLTFSRGCAHSEDESQGVCHIPEPGTSDDVWWFGFDCAHYGDLSPGMLSFGWRGFEGDIYRDIDYVSHEVTSLAAQLDVLGVVSQAIALA